MLLLRVLCLQLLMIESYVIFQSLIIDVYKVTILEELHEIIFKSIFAYSLLHFLVLCFDKGLLNFFRFFYFLHFNFLLLPVFKLSCLARKPNFVDLANLPLFKYPLTFLDRQVDNYPSKHDKINCKVKCKDIQEIPAIFVPLFGIWNIIAEKKEAPDTHQDDSFIKDVYEVVY